MNTENNLEIRFSELEKRIKSTVPKDEDEIDIVELLGYLWKEKYLILSVTFCFAVLGVVYALSLPNVYRSEGVYSPASPESEVGSLASKYGGLAAVAGIDLKGGGENDIDQALVLVTSWPFLEDFIEKENISTLVLGVHGWDKNRGVIEWDKKTVNTDTMEWRVVDGESLSPTSYELFKALQDMISVSEDSNTGLVRVSVDHYSPAVAQEWVERLIASVNSYFRERDIGEATANITFLNDQISKTSVSDMKAVLYGMVETQVKTLMMADVRREYLLKTVVPPKVAEEKVKPSRALIVAGACLLGGVLSVAFVFARSFVRRQTGYQQP